MTISSSADHDDIMRKSILDVYSMIDESALKRNVATIGDAIISTVYQSKVSFLSLLHWRQLPALVENLILKFDDVIIT